MPTTSRARVTQITPEEAARLRSDQARRVVDATANWTDAPPPPAGNLLVRGARAVAGAVRSVGAAVSGATAALVERRTELALASKAGLALVAQWGYEAAKEEIRAAVRRKVTGAISGSSRPTKGEAR